MRLRSFVAWAPRGTSAASAIGPGVPPRQSGAWLTWREGELTLRCLPRREHGGAHNIPIMVLGDDAESRGQAVDECLAGGVVVRFDRSCRALVLCTSIVALPPVFLYEGPRVVALASDIALLAEVPGIRLELDPRGVAELGWFGHPVEHRTLFRGVTLAPAATRIALLSDATLERRRIWKLPEDAPTSWPAFLEMQIGAFTEATRRIDVSRSFLSLTAGLDTRTVFASLAADRRLVPGATMTGPRASLDARVAAKLCRTYGVRHEAVVLDGAFTRSLPELVERASRLSGGLSSLGQAHEVFLYDQLGSDFTARLSGNLGNQVGRGGTEGVSIRAANLAILAEPFRSEAGRADHWLLSRLENPRAGTEFILEAEIAFTSVGNYQVGSAFATQQSPYASRALIESLAFRPRGGSAPPSSSGIRMRLRDLRHRFVGENASVSFQRELVRRIGGPASKIPVNWGWRPSGGVSIAGVLRGTVALVGMLARSRGLDDGTVGALLARTGIPALHDFRETRRWLRHDLRTFVLDILRSRQIREAGLFQPARLDAALARHFFEGGDEFETITFALDVALAHRMTTT